MHFFDFNNACVFINVCRFNIGNIMTKSFPCSLRSLEVKLHVYIRIFHRDRLVLILMIFISECICINARAG